MGRDTDWPTKPTPAGDALPIHTVGGLETDAGRHATLLIQQAGSRIASEDETAFQVVVESKLGDVTLPCLTQLPDGSHKVFVSHAGAWDDGDVARLLEWVTQVRASHAVFDAVIELIHDAEPPVEVADIIGSAPRSILPLLARPDLSEDPTANAELLATLVRDVFEVKLGWNRDGLKQLEAIARDQIGPVPDAFALREPLVQLIGSFVGEVLVRQVDGASWADASPDGPPWAKLVRIDTRGLKPTRRAAKFLARPGAAKGLVELLDTATRPGAGGDSDVDGGERSAEAVARSSDRQPAAATGASDAPIVSSVAASRDPGQGEISANGRRRIYRILCRLAYCDGDVDPSERARLEHYRGRFGLDQKEAVILEAEAAHGNRLQLGRAHAERDLLIQAMADIVAADGRLDQAEEKRLREISGHLGINPEEMIGWLRAALEARS